MTVLDVFRQLTSRPDQHLIRRWNWKSAIFSSSIRAGLFFSTNLTAGRHAAAGAMMAEFLYRAPTAGFYGALTQAFRQADPPWAAAISAMVLLPLISHSIELLIHFLRGTPHLAVSLICSVCFTALSTLFNLYAMRRGVLLVGAEARSVSADLRALPRIIAGFLVFGPMALYQNAGSLFFAFQSRIRRNATNVCGRTLPHLPAHSSKTPAHSRRLRQLASHPESAVVE